MKTLSPANDDSWIKGYIQEMRGCCDELEHEHNEIGYIRDYTRDRIHRKLTEYIGKLKSQEDENI